MSLAAIRARHQPTKGFDGPSGFCLCGDDWPCDAAKLLELLTPERIEVALHRAHGQSCYHGPSGFKQCQSEASALLAALVPA